MNFKNFLLFSVLTSCPIFSVDDEALMMARGLDGVFHPVTTGLLSICAAAYCAKKEPINKRFIMIGAAVMNCLGGFNDCSILNNIQEKNKDRLKSISQQKEDEKRKDTRFPLFLIGQLIQLFSFGVNSYYFYQSRNLYSNKQFWSIVASYSVLTFGRLLKRSKIQQES